MSESADRLKIIVDRGKVGPKRSGDRLRRPASFEVQTENAPQFSGIKSSTQNLLKRPAFFLPQPYFLKPQDRSVDPRPSARETDPEFPGKLAQSHTPSSREKEEFVGLPLFGCEPGIFDITPQPPQFLDRLVPFRGSFFVRHQHCQWRICLGQKGIPDIFPETSKPGLGVSFDILKVNGPEPVPA